ncbi:MAG: hypothetical protein II946_02680 [Kiritimatiellae bacterium]|nr:hypothetical protein [Kiritimatiellia bacterium]
MTVAEIGRSIDGLDLWQTVMPYHWALKPRGTALPYFCAFLKGDNSPVKARILLLEGWQTFHEFIKVRIDRNFGFTSSPMELAHFELVFCATSEDPQLLRYDAGYMPCAPSAAGEELCRRMLWEVLGVMMRLEGDAELPFRYAAEKALFARIEGEGGVWRDAPLAIQDTPPHVERISFTKSDLAVAKDLPFAADEALEMDFRLIPGLVTREKRPRCAYMLSVVDAKTGELVLQEKASVDAESGLRGLWEAVPSRVLKLIVSRGRIPGEIRLLSGRMFRMMRALCMHLPFKLSLHDGLPRLEKVFPQ